MKRYLLPTILLISSLACGNALNPVNAEPRPTRVKVIRFNTPTSTVTPLPTLPPTEVPVTLTPTSTPTEPPVPPTPSAVPTDPPTPTATSTRQTAAQASAPRADPPTAAPAIEAPSVSATLAADEYHLGYGVQLAEAKNMDLAAQGGFTWAKHDLNIRKEVNYIANADNLLNDLLKSGTEHVLLKLIVWSEAGLPDAPRDGDEVEDFAESAAEAAEFIREKHGSAFETIAYEIWNEPNLNYEWEGNPNPAEFVALLRAASTAIRQADPQAIIVSGAPSPGGDFDDLKFLDGMYANGAKGLMDAVGSHPYGGPWPYDHPTGVDAATGHGYPYFRKAEAQRAIMERYGDLETEIWATEFSWLAGLPNCDYGEHTMWQVTPQKQAEYLVAAYEYAHRNWPWMGPMFVVYDFALTGRYDRCHPATGYSILRPAPDGSDNIVSSAAQALFAMAKYPSR